jgi:hypothetical protein
MYINTVGNAIYLLLNACNSQFMSQNVILYNEYQTYAGHVSF